MKFFLIIISILFIFIKSNANENIVFIDIDFIVANSKLGKSVIKQVEKKKNNINKELVNEEKKLKEKENKIISQKNVLNEKQYKNELDQLKNMIAKYQIVRKQKNEELNKFTLKANNQMLTLISPIINDYLKEKSISIILQKKHIVTGRNDLNITAIILSQLDNNIKKIDLDKIQ